MTAEPADTVRRPDETLGAIEVEAVGGPALRVQPRKPVADVSVG